MSPNRSRRAIPALLLLTVLLTSLPASASPARRDVAALGEEAIAWIQDLFGSLWMRGAAKERMSINPKGQQKEGAAVDPNGQPKEGTSLDPDGSHH
jgi:hypothetical protein